MMHGASLWLDGKLTIIIASVVLNVAPKPASDTQNSTEFVPSSFGNVSSSEIDTRAIHAREDTIFPSSITTHSALDGNYSTVTPDFLKPASVNTTLSYTPNVYPKTSDNSSLKFDERRREDAYEKKPAAESPYAVLLIMFSAKGDRGTCSGSLLTPDWVLTAAHCLLISKNTTFMKILVYAGGYSFDETSTMPGGTQLREAKKMVPHPKYKAEAQDYDIGLVMVGDSFQMTDTVGTAAISTQPWNHRGYRDCELTGFGKVQMGEKRSDDLVRKTQKLKVKHPCLCNWRLKVEFGRSKATRYLCAKPVEDYGPCVGDSGGGLLCDGEIRAVTMMLVSFRETDTCQISLWYRLITRLKCGTTNTLNIFQDTCQSLRWINSHVKLFNDSQISNECVEKDAASRLLRGGGACVVFAFFVNILINKTLSSA